MWKLILESHTSISRLSYLFSGRKIMLFQFDEDLAEILKVKDNTSFSSLLLNEKKLDFEMISGVFNLQ